MPVLYIGVVDDVGECVWLVMITLLANIIVVFIELIVLVGGEVLPDAPALPVLEHILFIYLLALNAFAHVADAHFTLQLIP